MKRYLSPPDGFGIGRRGQHRQATGVLADNGESVRLPRSSIVIGCLGAFGVRWARAPPLAPAPSSARVLPWRATPRSARRWVTAAAPQLAPRFGRFRVAAGSRVAVACGASVGSAVGDGRGASVGSRVSVGFRVAAGSRVAVARGASVATAVRDDSGVLSGSRVLEGVGVAPSGVRVSVTSALVPGVASSRGVCCGLPGPAGAAELSVCVGPGVLRRAPDVAVLSVRIVAVAKGSFVPSGPSNISGP